MNCLKSLLISNPKAYSSSLISSYYASELIPNYKEFVKNSISKLELSESPYNCDNEDMDIGTQIQNTIKKKYNFIIPAIVIELNPESEISLIKEDLEKLFSTFGEIKYIDIQSNSNKAYLLYKFYFSALYAFDTIKEILSLPIEDKEKEGIKDNDNMISIKLLSEEGKSEKEENQQNKITPIKVNYDQNSKVYVPRKYQQETQNNVNGYYSPNINYNIYNSNNNYIPYLYPYNIPVMYNNYNFATSEIKFNTFSSREYLYKFVCNYDVQIENDTKFNVTKRIIGQNGITLKKIIYESCIKYQDYSTKVRLRGRGSGYKEGEENKESDEPLQLCVSSLNYTTYLGCCKLIENLLCKIYCDYYSFCLNNNIQDENPRQIKKYDFVVNRFGDSN